MGREMTPEDASTVGSLENKPGIFLVGCPNVGKRTILSRLLSIDIPEVPNLSSGVLCQGWTLETKYYSAEILIWTGHLDEVFSFERLLASKQLAALVMVFDISDESSFLTLKKWVNGIDLGGFEILLCIGNKADLACDHYAHVEYRRCLQKQGESEEDPHPEFWDYGINGTEGCSLLGNEDPSVEIKKKCMEWCIELNIEYIEACASNANFDKCLSVGGDIQGVERIHGALSAHMWPGMTLKTGNKINIPTLIEKEDSTDGESDYEIEYKVLSGGSDDEPWDTVENLGSACSLLLSGNKDEELVGENHHHGDTTEVANQDQNHEQAAEQGRASAPELEGKEESADAVELEEDLQFSHDDLDRLMGEIGNMRGSLRLMPDFQRREMAAKLAMKMATMFGGECSDDDEGVF